jgi:transposase
MQALPDKSWSSVWQNALICRRFLNPEKRDWKNKDLSEGILNPGSKTGSARSRALSPGRAERHGFQYYRHGTLSLYAALDVKTGRVEGHTAKRDTSAEFLVFLRGLLRKARWAREIHIVLDNLSAHKTKAVQEFLQEHPRVRFHFTPTYSSWLNQVELWFAKIQRDVIARRVHFRRRPSPEAAKIHPCLRQIGETVRWTYIDPSRRIRTYGITGTAY